MVKFGRVYIKISLICILSCVNLVAQDSVKTDFHNISFGEKDCSRKASINIGLSGDINELRGVQAELFSAFVRSSGIGYNTSLFATVTIKNFTGLQNATFINVVGRTMKGLQTSAIVNVAITLHGVQMAGFNNICGSKMKGLQLSGVSNISMGVERGAQISGIMNVCEEQLNGFQFSVFNYADTLKGNQLGIINLCVSHPHGLQIGIINYARTDSSSHSEEIKWQLPIRNRKIGLVNISAQTRIQMMLYAGNTNKLNIAARFLNEMSYSILGFGSQYVGLNEKFSGSLFYRTGFYKHVNENSVVSTDVGYYHIETFENANQSIPKRLYSLQARANFEYKLLQKFSLFFSCGYEFTRYYVKNEFYNKRFLFDMGIIVF